MTNATWLQGCEICDAALCKRMEELRSQGHTYREAAKIMEAEGAEHVGEMLWTAPQIRRRYMYHSGKGNGTKRTTQILQNQPLDTSAYANIADLVASGLRFGTIYADPPWPYQNQGTRAATSGIYKSGQWQMTIDDLCALPIRELTAEKAHLHLWTTNAFLFECPKIFEAWGFDYKGVFVWVKPQMGIGNYWRVSHEFMVLGVKGGLTFPPSAAEKSWRELPRTKHSVKPDVVAEIIEKVSPRPYLELFARRTRPNWTVWGNEIERTLFNDQAFQNVV